jgi:hypothetical protein
MLLYETYCALGMLYKYALLERTKISKVWGSHHNFHLAHPILIRPVELIERKYQRTTKRNFRPRRDEIVKIQQKKGRLAEQPPNQGLKGAFVFWKFAYLLTRRSNWGDSKSRIKWDKRSIT